MRRSSVAIGGMMGVGKSTVGRRVASRMGLPFVDTDSVLEERFGPIRDQLQSDPALFREREAQVVADELRRPSVIATGGGAWADPRTRARIRAGSTSVVLHTSVATLRARTGDGAGRPLAEQLEGLLAERAEAYADADFLVDASGDADAVAEAVLAHVDPVTSVHVSAGMRDYEVALARTFAALPAQLAAAGLAGRAMVVVTDATVAPLWLTPTLDALGPVASSIRSCVIAGGEERKDVSSWVAILDALLAGPLDRSSVVVALGGGVVGDLTGFAAACVLRGLPWALIPTTLLAMVDSSVGGKTGFNHRSGKNLIGAFHAPRLVYSALDTLTTLDPRQFRSGFGEIVKTAVVGDPDLLEILEQHASALLAGDPVLVAKVVSRAVATKAAIVSADEQESGRRAVLNLGHTVGHGLEAALGFGRVLHGEAVALGVVAECRWAVRRGVCLDPHLPERLAALHASLGLPVRWPDTDLDAVVAAMRLDKKGRADSVLVPVPLRVGEIISVPVPSTALAELVCRT
ncbi:MAG: shikimate kinase/3-dehydroquinate synthase [Myxococcota bacterium]|jgi:shikimate kinase/3-dehydroquinate synthase